MNDLARLDVLLAEMRLWSEADRVPDAILRPLYAEYAACRAALARPAPGFDLAEDPTPTSAKTGGRSDLSAFLERRNIAALHVLGSLLVLVGVVALVQWQWASWGRGILWCLLALASGGLMAGGDRLRKTEPQSGRTLGLIGAALVPLCCVAGQALGLTDGLLSWPAALLIAGMVSVAVSLARLKVTRDPLLLPLLGAGAALSVGAGAALLPEGAVSVAVREIGWLALAAGAISAARIIPSASDDGGSRQAFSGTGLGLMCLALGGGWWELIDGSRASGGFSLLGAALVGGFAASALELPLLAYLASAALIGGTLALTPDRSSGVLHSAALAAASLFLALSATLHRRAKLGADAPYRHGAWVGAALAGLTFLPGIERADAPLGWMFALVSVAWFFLAKSDDDEISLGAAAGIGLLATRLAAIPLDAWLVKVAGIAPSPERWLLVSASLLGLSKRRSLRCVAGGALAWACLFQIELLFGRRMERTTGTLTLLLAASGAALWSRVARSAAASYIALAPLAVAIVTLWLDRAGDAGWILSPLWPALALFLCALAAKPRALRGTLLCVGAAHLGALLPNSLLDLWPLATVPALLYLARAEDDDLPAALGAAAFGVFLAISAPETLALGMVGAAFAVVLLAVGWVRERPLSLAVGAGIASVSGMFCWAGFPRWHPTLAQTGLAVAFVALLWQGVAAALRRSTEKRWRTLSAIGLAASAFAAFLAFLGAAGSGQGRISVLALGLTGVTLFGAAGLRRDLSCLNAGFLSCLAAFGLFLFDRIGFGPDRLDWFLLPLGLYVLAVAELARQPSLRLPGLLFLLAPSLVASYLTAESWVHAVLLAALCVICALVGIARRVRAYLGSGLGFLIALLAIRLWEPLRAINYGVYLTVLGVGVLWLAISFERRREALLAWARGVKEKYEGWE